MSEQMSGFGLFSIKSHEQGMDVLKRLLAVAEPGTIFSTPVTSGDQMVITASEVSIGLGLGYGGGGDQAGNGGNGGGGGGGAVGRPVAVISIGPAGVHVEPVVDPTKIALAFFTMLGGILIAWSKMRKASRS
ncbi:MAG: spore germination protein GerW family protein [Chloroflexi bacterium]|nr:spore germination protein GerW family protein [Chloroflexota bacterium]